MNSAPALVMEAIGVDLAPGRPLFDGVDIQIAGGEIAGIRGMNGAGKTTLLNVASFLLAPARGTVTVNGVSLGPAGVSSADLVRARVSAGGSVARSFQSVPATSGIAAWRYVVDFSAPTSDALRSLAGRASAFVFLPFVTLLSSECRKIMAAKRDQFVAQLDRIGIDSAVADQSLDALSLGVRRLLDVLRALEAARVLFVLDEPFANLRPAVAARLCDEIRAAAGRGAAGLVTDHDVGRLETLTDRLYQLTPSGLVQC